jgi:hypothetical protein
MNVFECLSYMSYIYTRKHHKEGSSSREISFRKSSVRGSIPKDSSVRGVAPDGKIHFPLMTKGKRFIICKAQRHGSRGSNVHRKSMSDMTSVLHDMNSVLHQSVSINAKGGDFLLIGLVFIDVHP